jgi:4-hydroxy-2-oxoheptanedioate aldolase
MSSRFRELLAAGELVRVFALGRILHPVTIDLFGLAGGFHGFWLDQEHCGLGYQQIQLAAACARANNFDCFVRMAPTDYALVTQNLEAGAGGVMAAQIKSAAHAEQFVTWAKFAPRGLRGLNTSGRDALYTHKSQEQFAHDANREQFLAIQIETLGALEEADAIAANDAVDLLFVGPSDLSQAMGVLGQFSHPRLIEGLDRVAAACRRHGKHWGTVAPNPEYTRRCYEKGCRMLSLGADVSALRQGIDVARTTYKDLFAV